MPFSAKEDPSSPGSPLLKPTANAFQSSTPNNRKNGFTTPKPWGQRHRTVFGDECSTAAPSLATDTPGLWTPGSIQGFGSPAWDMSLWDTSFFKTLKQTSGFTSGPPEDNSIAQFALDFERNFGAGGLDIQMLTMLPPLDMDEMAMLALPPPKAEWDAQAFNLLPSTPDQGPPLGKHATSGSLPWSSTQGPLLAQVKKDAKAFSPFPTTQDQCSPGKHAAVVSSPQSTTQGLLSAKVESDAEALNVFLPTPNQSSLGKHAPAVSPPRSPTQGPHPAKMESDAEAFNPSPITPDEGSLGKHAVGALPRSPLQAPRAAKVESDANVFSPSLPTLRKHAVEVSPPLSPMQGPRHIAMPGAPKNKKQPLLMQVLELAIQGVDNSDKVRALLALDPDAVLVHFWGDEMEPPLCCAVRCGCSAKVIELLLKHGACAEDVGSDGQSPLDVLRSSRALPELGPGAAVAVACPVEKLLLEAGAKPQRPIEGNLDGGRCQVEKVFLEAGAKPQPPIEGNLDWGIFEGNLGWGHLGKQELAQPVWPAAPVLGGQAGNMGRSQREDL